MAKVKSLFFDHDFYAMSDEKIRAVRSKYDMLGYGVYFGILEFLAQNGGTMLCRYSDLAYEFHVDDEVVRSVIEDFGLFSLVGEGDCRMFKSDRLCRHLERMDEMREARSNGGKKGMEKRWGKTNAESESAKDNKYVISSDNLSCNSLITSDNNDVTGEYQNVTDIDIDKDNLTPPSINAREKNSFSDKATEFYIDQLKSDHMKKIGIANSNPDCINMENFDVMVEKFRSWMRLVERKSQSYGGMISTFISWLRIEHKENQKLENVKNNQNYGKSGKIGIMHASAEFAEAETDEKKEHFYNPV